MFEKLLSIKTLFTLEFTYVFVVRTSSHRDLVEPLNISNESFRSSAASSGSLESGHTRLSNIIFSHFGKLGDKQWRTRWMFEQFYLLINWKTSDVLLSVR